jgi:hypothetical protein
MKTEKRMGRVGRLAHFHLVTTADHGYARRAGSTRTTTHRCVLGIEISSGHRSWMHSQGQDLNGADPRHIVECERTPP